VLVLAMLRRGRGLFRRGPAPAAATGETEP
jgi:hypothetical protein